MTPRISDLPADPPREGTGRVLIDATPDPAKVSRVIETSDASRFAGVPVQGDLFGSGRESGRKTELLCITPCAVDLRTGAHELVFTSTRDPSRTSTAEVPVAAGTTTVRHALGAEKPWSWEYSGGMLTALSGVGFMIMGGTAFGVGALGERSVDADGRVHDPKEFLVVGAVAGAVGLAALTTGVIVMAAKRPSKRPGATTVLRAP